MIFSSIFGPWITSRRFVAGATAMADMLAGPHSAAGKVYHIGYNAAGGALDGLSTVLGRFRRKPARE
jgi:hypothetical protein